MGSEVGDWIVNASMIRPIYLFGFRWNSTSKPQRRTHQLIRPSCANHDQEVIVLTQYPAVVLTPYSAAVLAPYRLEDLHSQATLSSALLCKVLTLYDYSICVLESRR